MVSLLSKVSKRRSDLGRRRCDRGVCKLYARAQRGTRRGHKTQGVLLTPLSPFGLIEIWFDIATEVASDVVSHQIWGPRKKSWSLPMTILAGIMRNAGRHSNLVDIVSPSPFSGSAGRSDSFLT